MDSDSNVVRAGSKGIRKRAALARCLATIIRPFDAMTSSTGAIMTWTLWMAVFVIARKWLPALAMLALPIGGLINNFISEVLVGRTRPHTHALTSLVIFNGDSVSKVYAPGFMPRALYWLAYQAEFPYIRNRVALQAAVERRNLAGQLSEHWFGESRVARATGVDTVNGRYALTSEFVDGHEPADRAAAKAFLVELRGRFEEAGPPTWQIDPRQLRAVCGDEPALVPAYAYTGDPGAVAASGD